MNNQLKKFREKIDEYDKELIEILAKRFGVTKKIGEYKVKEHLPIFDKKREKAMFLKNKKLVEKLNLDLKLIEQIFKLILKNVKKEHKKIKQEHG